MFFYRDGGFEIICNARPYCDGIRRIDWKELDGVRIGGVPSDNQLSVELRLIKILPYDELLDIMVDHFKRQFRERYCALRTLERYCDYMDFVYGEDWGRTGPFGPVYFHLGRLDELFDVYRREIEHEESILARENELYQLRSDKIAGIKSAPERRSLQALIDMASEYLIQSEIALTRLRQEYQRALAGDFSAMEERVQNAIAVSEATCRAAFADKHPGAFSRSIKI